MRSDREPIIVVLTSAMACIYWQRLRARWATLLFCVVTLDIIVRLLALSSVRDYSRTVNSDPDNVTRNVTMNVARNDTEDRCENYAFTPVTDLYKNIAARLKHNPRGLCGCGNLNSKHTFYGPTDELPVSSCSDEATLLGLNQKVISYSFNGRHDGKESGAGKRAKEGIWRNLDLMRKFYPGWVMRVYTDVVADSEICSVVCVADDVYFCNMSENLWGGVKRQNFDTWRFLPLGDSVVDLFVTRNLEYRLSEREKRAVDAWEKSSFAFHAMRDHPHHRPPMISGLWGASNSRLCPGRARRIQFELFQTNWTTSGFNEQEVIMLLLYSRFNKTMLVHDSYQCEVYGDGVPFPVRRPNNYEFIGLHYSPGYKKPLPQPCPVKCRPSYGQDWQYC